MKFYGTPNMLVRIKSSFLQRVTRMRSFHFDDNGVFETENERLIEALKRRYKYDESDDVENNIGPEKQAKDGLRHCKKCDFTCNTQGELLAHYRAEHPKN